MAKRRKTHNTMAIKETEKVPNRITIYGSLLAN
jgi:hypothetical protein